MDFPISSGSREKRPVLRDILDLLRDIKGLLSESRQGVQREYLSIKEAAGLSGLSPTSIYRAIHSGKLTAHNPNASLKRPTYRIKRYDLETFLERIAAESSALRSPPPYRTKKSAHYPD